MGSFEYVPAVQGTGLAVVLSARGAAFGDLFNDGKIDVVINPIDGPPVLLRNVHPDHHHWVELSLTGGPRGPRDASRSGRVSDDERHASTAGRAEFRKLHFVK